MQEENTNFLLEAEASFYESLSKINHHSQMLTDGSINISFDDSTPYALELRKTFYDFLIAHIESLNSFKKVYETLCQAHGVSYSG